jgi:hypothetical protein
VTYDGAQLAVPLAFNDSEFSWFIFEVSTKRRRFAGLVSIHRTGPRARSVSLGPRWITGRDLPAPLRELVPSWLPILSPVKVATDDRPLFLAALYDLDARTQPIVIEHEIEHADFDAATFAASAAGGKLSVHGTPDAAAIHVEGKQFAFDLRVRAIKPSVVFGDGTPMLHHGRIATSYVQRPRLEVRGDVSLGGTRERAVEGEGVHDHQWLRVTVPNLKWVWPHLRLTDGRELTGYVVRDCGASEADTDVGRERGRGGWSVDRDGTVSTLPRFDVRATRHVDTHRGRVPTSFLVDAPELDLRLEIDHVVTAPWIAMRAFGDVIAGGIYEGPIEVRGHPGIRGWIEVMNAAHVRLR